MNVQYTPLDEAETRKAIDAKLVPLPSISEQLAIYEQVNEKTNPMECMESEIDAQLTKAKRNKQSILSVAFSGRLQ